jgi:hypothetical protein
MPAAKERFVALWAAPLYPRRLLKSSREQGFYVTKAGSCRAGGGGAGQPQPYLGRGDERGAHRGAVVRARGTPVMARSNGHGVPGDGIVRRCCGRPRIHEIRRGTWHGGASCDCGWFRPDVRLVRAQLVLAGQKEKSTSVSWAETAVAGVGEERLPSGNSA